MTEVTQRAFHIHVSSLVVAAMLASATVIVADTHSMAEQVAAQLDAQTLDAFAAEDPGEPGRFVAAIYIGGHILTISAVHPAPAFVRQEIAKGHYRQVYSVLSTSADKQGRLFVVDFGELGLRQSGGRDEPFDITWRDATRQTMFDGNWRAQKLSEADYRERFVADEREYAGMLEVLDTGLHKRKGVTERLRANP